MKFTSIIKKLTSATAVLASAGIMAFSGQAAAIPYTGASTPALDHPGFNVYTGLGSNNGGVINEPTDFFMGKEDGTTGYLSTVNSVCKDGTVFDLRVYVHNGASTGLNDNGNGTGVARGTKVRVALPTATASNFPLSSTISASNASSVTDGMTIDCGGNKVTMSYITGSAAQYTIPGGTQALSDSIVTSGAPIGTVKPDGNVWGCWDQRVWVTLKVKVTATPVKPPVSNGSCKAVDVTTGDNRTVKATVNGSVSNATITGYKIDWGDGQTSNQQTDSHTYAKDGTFTIVTSVQVKFADGHSEWLSATACTKQVTFKPGQPPVIVTPPTPSTPTTLVNTGPGSIAGIFAVTSLIGAMAYRVFLARRLSRQ